MLSAEARERMDVALSFNPERPRITLRRDDVRAALADVDASAAPIFAVVSTKTERSWGRVTIDAMLATGALLGAGALGWLGALGKL